MMELAREAGVRRDDPFAGLRRVSPRESELVVPTAAEIDRLIEEVRRVGKAHSEESADLIEFLAFTGLRIGEARAVEWRDVQGDFLRVRGGEEGTKSGRFRRVPIGRRVRALLDRRGGPGAQGGIFGMKSPREALANACRRLGMPHLRVHDLRHVFATQAAEAGVDIPTLARWLGHNDGGILAMKTYGHVRDEHMERMGKLIG
jgi:integrase